jgi:ATP phosphoribosyltransferase
VTPPAEAPRLKLAIQKSGRLSQHTIDLLRRCGIQFAFHAERLDCRCLDFPLDLIRVRDDDIPAYVRDGVCDLGIVGRNVLEEKLLAHDRAEPAVTVVKALGFGQCRLVLATPRSWNGAGLEGFRGVRIATSYPATLGRFLARAGIDAEIVEISGSVEIAPAMGIADAICDLVASGSTLLSNGLEEAATVLSSEALLVATARPLEGARDETFRRLCARLDGVMRADRAKYIMMNAPRDAIDRIREIIPGMEGPTIMPVSGRDDHVAIHAVAPETVFWETIEKLKEAGASSILVVPIEKIIA